MPFPNVMAELLRVPDRQQTVLPELLEFFRKDPDELTRFLRTFGGTSLDVPGPELWRDLMRDEQMVKRLVNDPSTECQIQLCLAEKVEVEYLRAIFETVTGRRLPEPAHNGTVAGRQEAIKALTARFPKATKIIRDLFAPRPKK